MSLAQNIKQKALELGFDLVGITDASPIPPEQADLLADWLQADLAGQMKYMYANFEKRTNPANLMENARSVICVGLNYSPPPAPKMPAETSLVGNVANYAQYEDYHYFIKNKLRKLSDFIASIINTDFNFKICVDSVPLAERPLAARAGLGFIGKNHMLINPALGAQIVLGEIITDLKLEIDEPIANNCSNCDKCIKACPTGALREDGQFDAGKCISYLTIEYEGKIPFELTEKIGNRLFGCDECVLACPYQNEDSVCRNKQFKFYSDRARLNLKEILTLSQESFNCRFADSCFTRLGLEGLKRNAKICLANIMSRKG